MIFNNNINLSTQNKGVKNNRDSKLTFNTKEYNLKTCIYCAEEIKDAAILCKHCGRKQDGRDMSKHATILSILFIVFGTIKGVAGIVILFVLPIAGNITGNDFVIRITSMLGNIVGPALLLFALPSLIGGIGLFNRKAWARILILILSFLSLLSIPLGTALGIYGIWTLLKDETIELFNPKQGEINEMS